MRDMFGLFAKVDWNWRVFTGKLFGYREEVIGRSWTLKGY